MPIDDMDRDVFGINGDNPSPFTQPLLVIYFKGGKMWFIEVGGRIAEGTGTALTGAYSAGFSRYV